LSTITRRGRLLRSPAFDVFSPAVILPLSLFGFMLLGIGGMTLYSFLLFCLFLLAFILAYHFSRPSGTMSFPLIWKIGLPLFAFGAAAEFANIAYVGAIPLFEPLVRARLIPGLSYASFLLVPAVLIKITECLQEKKNRQAIAWFLSGLFLISLLGYRTEIYALMLGAVVCAYYAKGGKIRSGTALKCLAAFVVIALIANLVVMSYRTSPVSSFMDRFSFTTGIFSSIAGEMGLSPFGVGGGMMHLSILSSLHLVPGPQIGPRTFITRIFQMDEGPTLTPTIIGLPFIDFGIAGVAIFGALLGLIYGTGYKTLRKGNRDLLPVHALLISFLILTIETGIADLVVILYLLAYVAMLL
jgi:oligosaccharide repeat unit polymerase